MVSVARDRIALLFEQAERASRAGDLHLADRYVRLARRIGTRYNVRLPPSLRERFCRACLRYFREGATVRTRMRGGVRVRTCLGCGRTYRRSYRARSSGGPPGGPSPPGLTGPLAVPVDELGEDEGNEGAETDEA